MAQPGGADAGMGPNLASVQSLLDATRDRSGGEESDHDKSALAIMSAIMATPTEAMKSDIPGCLLGNVDRAVTTLGANITPQINICSSSKGNSFFFGFPEIFTSMGEGGAGGDDAYMGGEDIAQEMDTDGGGIGSLMSHDPWAFDEYPHADETIGQAAGGLGGVYHDDAFRGFHDYSPTPSPDIQQGHGEERGM